MTSFSENSKIGESVIQKIIQIDNGIVPNSEVEIVNKEEDKCGLKCKVRQTNKSMEGTLVGEMLQVSCPKLWNVLSGYNRDIETETLLKFKT